ncbi:Rv0909 family putative TA system antitoxin [uncultured Pseudodesulfovibrio sp.]|uniref:Rv0909 family putative TA system antitoxin n=1 Tax=uncultured Pseudodesulfovibrio sp. TaxID=2035858 RepID=UPI0029C7F225|nr:Rv0909 family putative TA system antitoxin [uncultured Pseudodesulfovibrio sp.]
MAIFRKFIIVAMLLSFVAVGYGCQNEGPAEKAGKRIDQSIEKAGDAIEDAGDKIEDAGDKVEDAVDK